MVNHDVAYISIGELSNRTGVNPITLRAWERRYGFLKPKRTEKGHRLYSEKDIGLITSIVAMIDQGVAIGQIRRFIGQDISLHDSDDNSQIAIWLEYIDSILKAIKQFNIHKLDAVYNEILSLYPIHIVTKQVILPLLKKLGERWEMSETGIAEEHFFSTYLRNKIGSRLHHQMTAARGTRIIFACLPEEFHEFGLLLFALYCLNKGCHPIILGANLPLNQLKPVADITNAAAIVLKGQINNNLAKALQQEAKTIKPTIYLHSDAEVIEADGFCNLTNDYIKAYEQIKKGLNKL